MPFTPSPVELSGAPSGGRWTSVRVAWSTDLDRLARSLDPVLARLRADARAEAATALEELARAGERVLAEIEALEVAKARLEADLLASYGALRTIEAQQIDALPAGAVARVSARVCPDRVVTEEIALATGVGTGEVARRLSLATAPRRHRVVLGALRAGATSLHRALQVASETAQLPDPDVTTVAEAVLAPSRDGRPVPQRTFTARLRRAVASVDARGSQERHAPPGPGAGSSAASHRTGWAVSPSPPTPPPIATVLDRLDTHARGRRGAGDPRTLDQLRADLATHALLHATGHPGPTAGPTAGPTTGPTAGPTAGPTVGDVPAPAPGAASGAVSGGAAALAWIVVPFEVATGESDTACELPGHGWVTAAHAREIITRPGSVWRTLPVDLRTGHALTRPTTAYRPTRAMVEHVQAVDGVCRGPGCQVPATRCDLDHETPWPRGETAVGNLHAKHRWHHNTKTDGIWTSRPVPDDGPDDSLDDGLEWTTLTGRTYTTHPKNWRDGLEPPPPRHPHPQSPPEQPATPAALTRSEDDPPPF